MVQLIPLTFLFWIASALFGSAKIDKPALLAFAFLGAAAIYFIIVKFMLNALNDPVVLRISDAGDIRWRPALRNLTFAAQSGSIVNVTGREVTITPAIREIPATSRRGDATVFKLPSGIVRPEPAQFEVRP